MFQVLCTRNSRPPSENVCGRGLSENFDVVAVPKIHINVIFSKAASGNQFTLEQSTEDLFADDAALPARKSTVSLRTDQE
jgi:hypothetical protein